MENVVDFFSSFHHDTKYLPLNLRELKRMRLTAFNVIFSAGVSLNKRSCYFMV